MKHLIIILTLFVGCSELPIKNSGYPDIKITCSITSDGGKNYSSQNYVFKDEDSTGYASVTYNNRTVVTYFCEKDSYLQDDRFYECELKNYDGANRFIIYDKIEKEFTDEMSGGFSLYIQGTCSDT